MKTGPGSELELVRPLVEDVHPGDVRGEQIGRELQAREVQVERAREGLREHRLSDPGEVLDQQMPLGQETEDAELERFARRAHRELQVRDHAPDDVRRDGGRRPPLPPEPGRSSLRE